MLLVVPILYYIILTLQVNIVIFYILSLRFTYNYFLNFILPTVNLSSELFCIGYTCRLLDLYTVAFIDHKQLITITSMI